MSNESYRSRIYDRYVNARAETLAPSSPQDMGTRAPYLIRLVTRHFPKNRNAEIMDLGCGHGLLLHYARLGGYTNLRGVDRSPEQVAAAKELGIDGVSEGDLQDALAVCEDCSIDVIIAFDVIEHFTREELIPFVDEVRRVLKPSGRWIIHVPNGESPFSGRMRYGDLTHELAFTRTSIAQLLYSSGFSDVSCFEDAPVVHGAKSAMRWVAWKVFRFILRAFLAAETGDIARDAIFSQNLLVVAAK